MERGRVTLSFPIPKKNERFKVGNRIDGEKTDWNGKRITVPNIRFDDKGISFDFTVESPAPQEYDALCNWVCCAVFRVLLVSVLVYGKSVIAC